MRIAMGIEYQGTRYCGWQLQEQLPTVQGCLQHALSKVAAHPAAIICAGRTDAGVHASGQVVHFDTTAVRNERAWLYGTNNYLPQDIAVRWVKFVEDEFHARFSAQARRYQYIIYNHPVRSALYAQQTAWQYRHLDSKKMQQAAQHLLGSHDFSAFRAAGCQAKTAIRTIEFLNIVQSSQFIIIDIQANAFLHHMVRNIAGVLIDIGRGKYKPSWAQQVLDSKDRTQAGITAPATGLHLIQVHYPQAFALPNDLILPYRLVNQ